MQKQCDGLKHDWDKNFSINKNICDSLQSDLMFGEVRTSLVHDSGQIPIALYIAIHESRQSEWSSHSS